MRSQHRGGITPTNWRPLTAYGIYDKPPYFVDVSSFLPFFHDRRAHNFTLTVSGQGTSGPTMNENWVVSGALHLVLGSDTAKGTVRCRMMTHEVDDRPNIRSGA
jgi:hypothetical protein